MACVNDTFSTNQPIDGKKNKNLIEFLMKNDKFQFIFIKITFTQSINGIRQMCKPTFTTIHSAIQRFMCMEMDKVFFIWIQINDQSIVVYIFFSVAKQFIVDFQLKNFIYRSQLTTTRTKMCALRCVLCTQHTYLHYFQFYWMKNNEIELWTKQKMSRKKKQNEKWCRTIVGIFPLIVQH